jgi:hypothetical protein
MNQNYLIVFITLFSLIVQPVGAQTNTAGSIGNIANSVSGITSAMGSLPTSVFPTNGAMPLMLQNATSAVQQKLYGCQASSAGKSALDVAGQLDGKAKYQAQLDAIKASTAAKNGKTASSSTTDKTKTGCYDPKYANGNYDDKTDCDLNCALPGKSDPSCSDYFNKGGIEEDSQKLSCWTLQGLKKGQSTDGVDLSTTKLGIDEARFETYATYMQFKAKSCATKKLDDYKAQLNVFNCEMSVLGQAVAQASNQVQTALTQNNAQYGKMNQFQQELGSQISQIDDILGPDDIGKATGAGGQFGGLLGLQKDLNAKLADMNNQQASFQSAVVQLQQDTTSNEQTLVSQQMQVVSSCLNGETNLNMSGAYSLTCRKARQITSKDSSGNTITTNATNSSGGTIYDLQSCSPVDFMKSEVQNAPFSSNNGVVVTQARTQQSSQNVLAMNSLMQSILRDLGQFDQATDAGKLVTNATTWSQIETKYGAAMDSLSASSGVDVRGQLRAIGGHCMNESATWKQQQQLSSSSQYNIKKTDLAKQQTALAAQLNTGMSGLNKDYADMMAALTGQVVTANRFACTTTDPSTMVVCYTNMRQNVQDVLEGNTDVPFTAKTISGGTMVRGFTVPCRGINGCVTSLKQVRDAQKKQSLMAEQQKTKFVNDSNQQVQTQVQGFAQFLSGVQNVVMNQFNNMKQILANMNVAGPEQPKYMDAESLQPSDGPNKEPGPFKAPNKMAAVLSGMVQPTGLIDFNSPGVQDGLKDASDKVTDAAKVMTDAADKAQESEEKLEELVTTCVPDDDSKCSGGGSVANNSTGFQNCSTEVNSCENAVKNNTSQSNLNSQMQTILNLATQLNVSNSTDKSDKNSTNIGTALDAVDGTVPGCTNVKTTCMVSEDSKTDANGNTKVQVQFGSGGVGN